ncbi:phage-like protein (plasmid) [Clostridioides difficile]
MSIIFNSENFYFNGRYNRDNGVILVTMDSDILNNYGLSYSEPLKSEANFNNNPYYFSDESEVETVTVMICLVDKYNNPEVWNDYILEDICRWLTTSEFKEFISEDNIENVYYFKMKKITKKFNHLGYGVLVIEFQPYTNYAYRSFQKVITVKNTREIKLNNVSNVDEEYAPVIDIESLKEGDITIRNSTISDNEEDNLVISGLRLNEKITIDNLYYTVLNSTGENRFNIVNRKWIRLRRGVNILKFTGNCKVSIKCKYPIIK